MGNRTAKFVSALVGSIIAGAPLAAVSQNAPSASSTAASDCLPSPKGAAPQGQHWYYRLDRASKRQCWYLRAEGAKVTQTAQATGDAQSADTPAQPSVQNAHAEYIAPQTTAAPAMTAPAPAAANAAPAAQRPSIKIADASPQPAVAAPWPDASTDTASPAPQAAPAPVAAPPQPGAKPAKPQAPGALAAAEAPADKPTGSLQTLMLVIGGALTLAGLLASVIYRFAGARARVRTNDHRHVNWDDREPHEQDRAPWLNEMPNTPRTQQPGPIDFDAIRPQPPRPEAPQLAAFSSEIGRIAAQSRSPRNEIADLDEADIFSGEFEIEASAPRLAVNDAGNDSAEKDEEPAARVEDSVDIDVITAMLERLAQEGPRLAQPSPEAAPADLARSRRGQSAARA